MSKLRTACLFALSLALSTAGQCQASDLEANYLAQLAGIHQIAGRGNEKLFTLIADAADELVKDWSPALAREVARVFNDLLDTDPNYFVVELLDTVLKARPAQFRPILNKALSPKNRTLYKTLRAMDDRENKYGNDKAPRP